LQYQVKELLASLSEQARTIRDQQVKENYYFLRDVAKSPRSVKKCCQSMGYSRERFYKLANRLLDERDLMALKPHSRRPKTSPAQTKKRVEKRICRLRNQKPYLGAERIQHSLADKGVKGIPKSISTVHKVLQRNGLVEQKRQRKLTKKHMKRYQRPFVGYLQMDFKYVPYLVHGLQFYQLSCIDHHSGWRLIRIYPRKDEEAVTDFLQELDRYCPFKIIQLQTDNDTAFTDRFSSRNGGVPTGEHYLDIWCKERGVEHKLIPVGQKEINGKVENSHRQDDRELYSQIRVTSLENLQQDATRYQYHWNFERKTKALEWRTPSQAVYQSMAFMKYWHVHMHALAVENGLTMTRLDQYGSPYIKVPKAQRPKFKKKTKKKTYVDRYLEYHDGEQKKKLKSILPVLPMSPDFSL
jgi:transposase InsO family protein